jgi:ABC-2 type transport system ATP-binding protein
MRPVLRLEGVRLRYGTLVAVDGLTLEARGGEILGLLGPNGAGKTTTVGLATGVLQPDEGRVEIAGAGPPSTPLARRRLGVAPQSLAVYEALTGRENLDFFASLHGLDGAARRERVLLALEFVGLADRAKDRVSAYSGGMKRRLNLAAAIVHDPEIVLLDEPTVGVDPQSRGLIFENVLALRDRGRAILYTTHYMEEAERLCDRVAIVDHGRLLAEGTVAALVAAHGGEGVRSVRVERARLEDVFLHLTGRHLRD